MKVAAVDQGFVLAAPAQVFALVGDPSGYPAWWPGVRSDGEGRLRFPLLGRVAVEEREVREGMEAVFRVSGQVARGKLQWYLEPFREGTIVYGITDVETAKRWSARRVLRHRASMRAALLALKDRFE